MKGLILLAQLTCQSMALPNGGCQWCCDNDNVRACRNIDRCETKEEETNRKKLELQQKRLELEILREKNKASKATAN